SVRVEDCSLGWFSGLRVGRLRVASASGSLEEPLLSINGLHLKYQPWELIGALTAERPNLGRAVIEWVSIRVVRDPGGKLDLLKSTAPAPDFESIKVLDGMVYLLDLQAGTQRYVSQLRVKVGRLSRSEKAYVTGSGRLHFPAVPKDGQSPVAEGEAIPQEEDLIPSGVISLSGMLDHFDLNNVAGIIGGCDIEWKDVNVGYFLPQGRAPAGLLPAIDAPTGGQVTLAIDEADLIEVEGSVSASQLIVKAPGGQKRVNLGHLTVGFIGSYNKASGDAKFKPVQVSGAGSAVRVSGELHRAADGAWNGELKVGGTLSWAPLKEGLPPLGEVLAPVAVATGTAKIEDLTITVADSVARLKAGSINLDRTEVMWKPWFEKPSNRRARLKVDARIDLAARDIQYAEVLLLVGDEVETGGKKFAAEVSLAARTGTAAADKGESEAGRSAGRKLTIDLEVPEVALLSRHMPAAALLVEKLQATGTLAAQVTVWADTDDLAVSAKVDGNGLSLRKGAGAGKPRGKFLAAEVRGRLKGPQGRPEFNFAELRLEDGTVTWRGNLSLRPGDGDKPPRTVFSGRLDARGVQQWVRLLRPFLSWKGLSLALVGNLQCDLEGYVDGREFFLDLQADAARASIELNKSAKARAATGRLMVKPLGEPAGGQVTAVYLFGQDRLLLKRFVAHLGDSTIMLKGRIDEAKKLVMSDRPDHAPPCELQAEVTSDSVDKLLDNLPSLESLVRAYGVGGGLRWRGSVSIGERTRVTSLLDLTDTVYTVPGELTKTAGLKQTIGLDVHWPSDSPDKVTELTVAKLAAVTGSSKVDLGGLVSVDREVLASPASPAALRHAVRSVDLRGRVNLIQGDSLRRYSRLWRRWSQRYDIEGSASAALQVSGTRDGGRIHFVVDGTAASFQYGMRASAGGPGESRMARFLFGEATRKPAGTRARVELTLKTTEMAGEMALEGAILDVADTHLTCSGTIYAKGRLPGSLSDVNGYVLRLEGKSAQLARLAQLLPMPGLRRLDPQGGVEFSVDVAGDPYSFELRDGKFIFDKAHLKYRGSVISIDGRLAVGRRRLTADGLSVAVGESSIVLAADIARPFNAPKGRLALTGEYLDLDKVLKTFGIEQIDQSRPIIGIPAFWPPTARLLGRMEVSGHLAFDRLKWTDDKSVHYDWSAFASDFRLADGQLVADRFKAVMLGGVVIGRVAADFREANPWLKVGYDARNLKAGPGLTALVKRQFPSLTIQGAGNSTYQARQRMFATAEQFNYPVGLTRFEALDGTIVGPVAPQWLAALFPGLKLSRYAFRKMESITRLRADGRAESDMLFDGVPYSLYIAGYTEADGTARYSLGVDLFNSLQGDEAARSLEQGRIPMLYFTGKIVGSEWGDQRVDYKLAPDVAYDLFLRRNLFFKILSVAGEKRRPDFKPYKAQFDTRTPAADDNPRDAGDKDTDTDKDQ
ncbi:MAG: hypothetical protein GWP05_05300, partial [Anaerolineaceae bacterium]|nr:hypothetical protein [Anaerolineaceae bacterium]